MTELSYRPARELARMIRDGETGSEALLDAVLERIERYNPDLNAVIHLDADRARKRAKEADKALARGEVWGPLHGLPMTIKESFEVTGMPTTAGAPELKDHRSSMNAVAAQRLLDAGAIIVGKTNVPLYTADLQSYNEIYGTSNNPWDRQCTPGGSSGGAAAALAAGLTPIEFGSDIGGSIRTPANFCGVCGHKPTYGLVPGRGHVPGPPGTLTAADIAVMGPLARTVDDLELALDLTAGPDRDQAVGWRLSLPQARHARLGDFRVAAWLDDPACPVEREVVGILQATVESLRRAGVAVDDRARPEGIDLAGSYEVFYELMTASMAPGLPKKVFDRMRDTAAEAASDDRSYRVRFARAVTGRHADWLRTHERRLHMRRAWVSFFEDFDILLCPVTNTLPFKHDHSSPMNDRVLQVNGQPTPYMDILKWVGLTGVVYLPVTVIPVGQTRSGLPVGVQIVGPYLEDRTCLAFARLLEKLTGGFTRPPGY